MVDSMSSSSGVEESIPVFEVQSDNNITLIVEKGHVAFGRMKLPFLYPLSQIPTAAAANGVWR
jgi:hypothetical protein